MKARALLSAVAATTVALTLAGCAADTNKVTTESGAQVVEEGKLTVCTHLPYEPFQYKEDGEIVGFDVDLVDLVAEELGLEQTIVNTPFETIETGQAMATGKCDLAAAGMTITDERARVMDFADPYFNATQALLVQEGSGFDSLESLSGETVGVQANTTGKAYAEENAPDDVELKVFEDLALLTAAVKTGDVAAGVNDNGVLYDYVEKNPDTEVSTEFDTGEQYGFAVAEDGSDQLLGTANEVLATSMEDGGYEEIFRKYFPDAELTMPE